MVKDLSRPRPHPINSLLGLDDAPVSLVALHSVEVSQGRNPRTMFLTEEERAELFSEAGLADLISSMTAVLQDGRQRGVLQPLLVRPAGEGRYGLVAGERRYHAARWAQLSEVPVQIRALNDDEAFEAAVIENGQRENPDFVTQTFVGFELMRRRTGLDQGELISHLNAVRQKKAEDTHLLDALLRQLFGTGISTWSQQRSKIFQLTEAERAAVRGRHLEAKAAFPLIRLGENPARAALLSAVLAQTPRPSSTEVETQVTALLQAEPQPGERPANALRSLLPRVRRLTPERADRVQHLVTEIEKVLAEMD